MATFDLIQNMYLWYAADVIGNEIIAAILTAGVLYALLVGLNLPPRSTFAFMIPVLLGFIWMGYLGWFGWLIIAISGMLFGALVYRLYERG